MCALQCHLEAYAEWDRSVSFLLFGKPSVNDFGPADLPGGSSWEEVEEVDSFRLDPRFEGVLVVVLVGRVTRRAFGSCGLGSRCFGALGGRCTRRGPG